MHQSWTGVSSAARARVPADIVIGPSALRLVTHQSAESTVAPAPVARATIYPRRSWTGVTAELVELRGPGAHNVQLDDTMPRLIVMLEALGGNVEIRLDHKRPAPPGEPVGSHHLTALPAHVPAWEYAADIRFARRVLFAFDVATLSRSFADARVPSLSPRLMFSDARIWRLGSLLAEECLGPTGLGALYGEGLALALFGSLAQQEGAGKTARRGGLSPHQLRRVTRYVEDRWNENIQLNDLATLVGLSASQFGRAFKDSTGTAPHRWQFDIRIKRAQELLLGDENSLADIALAAGFADQSHFTRTFRRFVGASPGAWRRERAA